MQGLPGLYPTDAGVRENDSFLALIFRMRHIQRWGLMHNTQNESLTQHTAECAFLAHYLAVIGNTHFGKAYNADKIAVCALFHDVTEVLTGDLPTPVKYYNENMRQTYKDIEKTAAASLLSHLPEDVRTAYDGYLHQVDLDYAERRLLKIADKLCAYIKCMTELNAGNNEFRAARDTIQHDLDAMESEELHFFMKHCAEAFSLSLDELKGTL